MPATYVPFHIPPDMNELVAIIALSLFSGAISISQRITAGHTREALWIITEFMSAVLFGWLMYQAYPYFGHYLPEYLTMPVFVAIAAHSGGRVFQEIENDLIARIRHFINGRY